MRPIFCGNVEYDARQSDLERLFGKYGRVERADIKSGFAFIYMDDERDAEDAIRGLDGCEFGRQGRRLRVEWTKHERGGRGPVNSRRSSSNNRCTKTLFVINFDPINTRSRDLERHFDPYGKISNIRIRRNFAFIQYENQEDATKALDATNMSNFMDRVLSVEYAIRDDDDKRNGYSPERRDYGRSPERSRDRRRSASPCGRGERGSPDYGRGSNPHNKSNQRGSSDYGNGRRESPVRERYPRDHSPRREHSRSPKPEHSHSPRLERSRSPKLERSRSARPDCSPKPEPSHSPKPERSGSPRNEHSYSPRQELPPSPIHERSDSPRREYSGSPQQENSRSP